MPDIIGGWVGWSFSFIYASKNLSDHFSVDEFLFAYRGPIGANGNSRGNLRVCESVDFFCA
jgi:hypothetical protein